MSPLSGHGLDVTLPAGWDGRIYLNEHTNGARSNPVMHIGTFPLPKRERVGDYGNGAIELMGPSDAFVALVEFNPELSEEPLFLTNSKLPHPLGPGCFAQNQMQRIISGMGGAQFFFNEKGRAFSLYAVLGSLANARAVTARMNPVVHTITIATRPK